MGTRPAKPKGKEAGVKPILECSVVKSGGRLVAWDIRKDKKVTESDTIYKVSQRVGKKGYRIVKVPEGIDYIIENSDSGA